MGQHVTPAGVESFAPFSPEFWVTFALISPGFRASGAHFAVPVDDIVNKLRGRIKGPDGINDLGPAPTRRVD